MFRVKAKRTAVLQCGSLRKDGKEFRDQFVLYFVDRASRYEFLEVTNFTRFFMYLFTYFMSLHVSSVTELIIRRSNCVNKSSGMISLCK